MYVERHQQTPPRTHDLRFLGTLLGVPGPVAVDLLALNPAFGLARYPDSAGRAPVDVIGRNAATLEVDAARRVLAWARGEL